MGRGGGGGLFQSFSLAKLCSVFMVESRHHYDFFLSRGTGKAHLLAETSERVRPGVHNHMLCFCLPLKVVGLNPQWLCTG